MPSSKFDVYSLLDLQLLVWPLIRAITGVDVPGQYITPSAEYFGKAKEAVLAVADVLAAVESALQDGIVTRDELDAIIANALEVSVAVRMIQAATASGKDT